MRRDGSAPQPGVGRALLHSGNGRLKFQSPGRRTLSVPAGRAGMRAFEEHEHWLIGAVGYCISPAELSRHVADRLQSPIIAPALHPDMDIRGMRLDRANHGDILAHLPADDAR